MVMLMESWYKEELAFFVLVFKLELELWFDIDLSVQMKDMVKHVATVYTFADIV